MSLEIQIASDLHLEFWASKKKFGFLKPTAPILALLGDTCCLGSDDDFLVFRRFIEEILPLYEHIIIITGNHEYYFNPATKIPPTKEHTMDAINAKLKAFCQTVSPKLHFLNNSTLKLTIAKKKYVIVGSTLWSYIPIDQQDRIQKSMSDYQYIYVQDGRKIRNVTAKEISDLHLYNVKYLKRQIMHVKKEGAKLIIFTHHCPYIKPDHDITTFDPAYYSDLTSLIKSPVVFWGYGHTHIKDDTVVNGVRIYSNPKGYPSQRTGYNNNSKAKI